MFQSSIQCTWRDQGQGIVFPGGDFLEPLHERRSHRHGALGSILHDPNILPGVVLADGSVLRQQYLHFTGHRRGQVTGEQCQSTLTEVSRTNNSAGIWCENGIQVGSLSRAMRALTNGTWLRRTLVLGYWQELVGAKGQHIIATIPA